MWWSSGVLCLTIFQCYLSFHISHNCSRCHESAWSRHEKWAVQCDVRNYVPLHSAGTWALHTVDQTHIMNVSKFGTGEGWRSVGLIVWYRSITEIHEERNIPHTGKWRKGNWICHILGRNCLLSHITEEKTRGNDGRDRNMYKKM
jgi:hypothetical protein